VTPLKVFATTCVNLHQVKYIFYTHSHMYFKRYSKVSGGKQLLRLRNQIVNKIIPKLDFTAQLMSTQKAITVPTFKVDVESVLSSHGYTFAVVSAPD